MKNRTRVVILSLLLLVNTLFFLFTKTEGGVSFDEELFAVQDTSRIAEISIGAGPEQIRLSESQEGWQVNDQYSADERLVTVLLSILRRVQVKKPVDVDPENATEVSIAGGDPMSFSVWGNPTKTRTFFSLRGRDEAYEVVIPGYNEYVGGIFELNADQWRDRLVMNESWRTVQNLKLDYLESDKHDFSIQFDQDFYRMDKVNPIDSSAVIDYLNQFQYFEANEWISSGRLPRYDSLSTTQPLARLTIESINSELPVIVDVFPRLENDSFHLLMDREDNLMVVDQRRVSNILKKPEDFRRTE